MKKILLLMTIFAISLVNVVSAHDTLAKINFSFDESFNQDGWTNVIGGAEFPVVLDNGITIDYVGGQLSQGSSGEPTSTVVPNNVSASYNWWANTDASAANFTIVGLDPAEKYTFVIYASRDGATASGDRTTTYTIVGSSITGSVNPVGNTDQLVVLEDIVPAATGAVVMDVARLADTYGYINGWIILKQTEAAVVEQGPYGGVNWTIPGLIEAENYDVGGEGVAYHDMDPDVNNGPMYGGDIRLDEGVDIVPEDGGYVIGWFEDGEWLEYTVDIEAGTYDIGVRAGTPTEGLQLAVFIDEVLIAQVDIASTGQAGMYEPLQTNVVTDITLEGGTGKILKVMTLGEDFDFNWIEFTKQDGGGGTVGPDVPAIDTMMKLNFSFDGYNQDGWTNVIGGAQFPVVLDNGITIDYVGGELLQGSAGEPASTVVPNNVSASYNWWSNTDATAATFTIVGLDPAEKYTFIIYASRDGASASGDRTTTYSIVGSSITGSVNPVGNTDQLVVMTDIEPASTGAVVMDVARLADTYGYINGWIIGKQTGGGTAVKDYALAASVYPNPVKDDLTLTNLASGSIISVYSISGSKVLETWNGSKSEMKVGMGNFRTGVYLVNVKSGTSIQSFKVVKK